MTVAFRIPPERIEKQNSVRKAELAADHEHLGKQLARRHLDIDALTTAPAQRTQSSRLVRRGAGQERARSLRRLRALPLREGRSRLRKWVPYGHA